MAERIRVLVVDDSAFVRRSITQMLGTDQQIEVVGSARDGQDAIEKVQLLRPDVVSLDIEMPVMSGLAALRKIRQPDGRGGPAVLIVSSLTVEGSREGLQALADGASDLIAKPDGGAIGSIEQMRDELVSKIRAIAGKRRSSERAEPAAQSDTGRTKALASAAASVRDARLVAIGSSTGGPPVLERIVTSLPADMAASMVIAQHMPLTFTKSLAQRLDGASKVRVVHGEHDMPVERGKVYVAPGGGHMRVAASSGALRLCVSPEPTTLTFKPSADELLRSAAEACGSGSAGAVVGVVLTGIGSDGSQWAAAIKKAGGRVLAQDERSCVVYGMPRAVAERGLADFVGDPSDLASILRVAGSGSAKNRAVA